MPSREEREETWKWSDDLNIYAGDEVERYLHQMGLAEDQVELLRSRGGLGRALESPKEQGDALVALDQVSQMKGYASRWTVSNLRTAVEGIDPDQLGISRGKPVTELDVLAGDAYKDGLRELGRDVDIDFDFDVWFRWYPVESQRVLLYAARFGSQEAYADALARRHFTMGQAAGMRSTVLDSVEEVGLDPADVEALLNGDEYEADVWKSYKDAVGKHNVHSIPFFTFNGPVSCGGLFRSGGMNTGEITVNGSGNMNQFLHVFERIRDEQLD